MNNIIESIQAAQTLNELQDVVDGLHITCEQKNIVQMMWDGDEFIVDDTLEYGSCYAWQVDDIMGADAATIIEAVEKRTNELEGSIDNE